MRTPAKIITVIATLLSCLLLPVQSSYADFDTVKSDSVTYISPQFSAASDKLDEQQTMSLMTNAIDEAKLADTDGFLARAALLEGSDGFSQIMQGSTAEARVFYRDFFAAVADNSQIDAFIRNTDRKYIHTAVSSDRVEVTISDQPTMQTRGSDCWQAYVASYSFFAATTAICGAITAAGTPVAGVACALAFWGIGTLPDFNAACN